MGFKWFHWAYVGLGYESLLSIASADPRPVRVLDVQHIQKFGSLNRHIVLILRSEVKKHNEMPMWRLPEWPNFRYRRDILVVDYVQLAKGDGRFRSIVGDVINVILIEGKKGIRIESVERSINIRNVTKLYPKSKI